MLVTACAIFLLFFYLAVCGLERQLYRFQPFPTPIVDNDDDSREKEIGLHKKIWRAILSALRRLITNNEPEIFTKARDFHWGDGNMTSSSALPTDLPGWCDRLLFVFSLCKGRGFVPRIECIVFVLKTRECYLLAFYAAKPTQTDCWWNQVQAFCSFTCHRCKLWIKSALALLSFTPVSEMFLVHYTQTSQKLIHPIQVWKKIISKTFPLAARP